jgi:hypothetical protein
VGRLRSEYTCAGPQRIKEVAVEEDVPEYSEFSVGRNNSSNRRVPGD